VTNSSPDGTLYVGPGIGPGLWTGIGIGPGERWGGPELGNVYKNNLNDFTIIDNSRVIRHFLPTLDELLGGLAGAGAVRINFRYHEK